MLQETCLVLMAAVLSFAAEPTVAQGTWCGKVYNGSAQIAPGGILLKPKASSLLLLNVQLIPRHSIYLASEHLAELILDASFSSYHGSPYPAAASSAPDSTNDSLRFSVSVQGTSSYPEPLPSTPQTASSFSSAQEHVLVSGSIRVDTSNNLVPFNVSLLTPRRAPYVLTLTGSTSNGGKYTAKSILFYLPEKNTGSVVKIDRLYGSILFRSKNTGGVFKPYIPYGYYGDYSGYFNTTGNPTKYAHAGFNAVNPVTDFTEGNMSHILDEMDGINLRFQYGMRHSYQNLTSVSQQIPRVKDHSSLLTYYTADEPDGWGYTPDSTTHTYNLLVNMDNYHPTALALNCQNYFFQQYSAGADIIMPDVYPIGINASFSTKWKTPVNQTYGDCGCDNCIDSLGLLNVPARIEQYKQYGAWLGGTALTRKPIWVVLQAFADQSYWSRNPTAEEAWAMDILAFNHGAMGRLAWIYPTSAELSNAGSQLAKVITVSPVLDFLTGANPVLVSDGGTAISHLDVACWELGPGKGLLVGVVSLAESFNTPVKVALPKSVRVSTVASTPWGKVAWTIKDSELVAEAGLARYATSYVILK